MNMSSSIEELFFRELFENRKLVFLTLPWRSIDTIEKIVFVKCKKHIVQFQILEMQPHLKSLNENIHITAIMETIHNIDIRAQAIGKHQNT
jgi:hypothetical protein